MNDAIFRIQIDLFTGFILFKGKLAYLEVV